MTRTLLLAALVLGLVAAEPAGPLDFTLTAIDGTPHPLAQYRGKVVLIVNVASKCGLTKQYAGLQDLYARHQAAGLVVLGVPANDFRGQEPGTNAEIAEFCSTKYNVTFPMMAKVSVVGDSADPLYAWLTTKSPYPGPIAWNFGKFLVGRDGTVIARFEPKVAPDSDEVEQAVTAALAAPAPAAAK